MKSLQIVFQNLGGLNGGNSNVKDETSPFNIVLDKNNETIKVKNIPNKAILITANVETAPAKFSGTNAPIKMDAIKICVGQRPLHKEKLFVIKQVMG